MYPLTAMDAPPLTQIRPAPGDLGATLIEETLDPKARHAAVVVTHNYQLPIIALSVADFTGDSLAMARFAARSNAPAIVVCGVQFMAEVVKLLCLGRRVLLPSRTAGCTLAESITVPEVTELRRQYPRIPVVAYVNTSAAVKAETDICCTSANAVQVNPSLACSRAIIVPDRHLAGYVARHCAIEVITWPGACEVHVMDTEVRVIGVGAAGLCAAMAAGPQRDRARDEMVTMGAFRRGSRSVGPRGVASEQSVPKRPLAVQALWQ